MTIEEKQELISILKSLTEINKELVRDNMELNAKLKKLIKKLDNLDSE